MLKNISKLSVAILASALMLSGCGGGEEETKAVPVIDDLLPNDQEFYDQAHRRAVEQQIDQIAARKAEGLNAIKASLDNAHAVLAGSEGKVADNAVRQSLTDTINATQAIYDANQWGKAAEVAGGLNASAQAVADAQVSWQAEQDRIAAEAAAAAERQRQEEAAKKNSNSNKGGGSNKGSGSNKGGGSTGGGSTGGGSTGGGSAGGGSAGGGQSKAQTAANYVSWSPGGCSINGDSYQGSYTINYTWGSVNRSFSGSGGLAEAPVILGDGTNVGYMLC